MQQESKSLKIGLVFPELGEHDLDHFKGIFDKVQDRLDLIVFPEGFETISPSVGIISPEFIGNNEDVQSLLKKYAAISRQYDTAVILGFQIDYNNRATSGGGNDQYCAYVSPDGINYIYHKHSTSKFNAFFDSNWSIENNLKTMQLRNHRIGISVCHDSYISLISRLLAKKGADIWVNISYQNVRPHIWEQIHFTRAVENHFISICTLHRNSHPKKGEGKPQKEPYAFSPDGKIKLRDIESGRVIDDFPENNRTGKIYFFDVNEHEVIPLDPPYETAISGKADRLSILRKEDDSFTLSKSIGSFAIVEISLEEYFTPEVLWKSSLQNPDKTTLFIIRVQTNKEWNDQKGKILKTIKGRTIEFSTAFTFIDNSNNVLIAVYRSSNYKDSHIFYPRGFPVIVDQRYLKGIDSTCKISLGDYRNEDDTLYYGRINKIIEAIK